MSKFVSFATLGRGRRLLLCVDAARGVLVLIVPDLAGWQPAGYVRWMTSAALEARVEEGEGLGVLEPLLVFLFVWTWRPTAVVNSASVASYSTSATKMPGFSSSAIPSMTVDAAMSGAASTTNEPLRFMCIFFVLANDAA